MTKTKTPIYIGVFLDDASRAMLLEWFSRNVCELLENEFAHHMTVKFRPSAEDLVGNPEGLPVDLEVVGYTTSPNVQAVVVEGYHSANNVAHITVATDGSPPKLANDLLARGFTAADGPRLNGTMSGFYGK